MTPTETTTSTDTTFDALLAPLLGPAYGTALSLTGNAAEAEDLLQEAALNALKGFDSFEPGTNFKAWFFRILTNCFYGQLRQRRRRPRTVDFDDVPDLYLYARTEEVGLHTTSEDPARALMTHVCLDEVQGALAAIPHEYRVVATLYFLEDLTYDEIAKVLDCPMGTVRSRLHRGRRMLQKALWHLAQEEGIVDRLTQPPSGSGH